MTSTFVDFIIQCSEYADSYFNGDDYITGITGKKETAFMGNLCAYQFWQRVFKVHINPIVVCVHSLISLEVDLYRFI